MERPIKNRSVIDINSGRQLSVQDAYELVGSRGRIGWDYFLKMLNPESTVKNSTTFEYLNNQ